MSEKPSSTECLRPRMDLVKRHRLMRKLLVSQNIQVYVVKDKGPDLTTQDVDNFLAQKALAMKSLSEGVMFLDSIPKITVSLDVCLRDESCLRCV